MCNLGSTLLTLIFARPETLILLWCDEPVIKDAHESGDDNTTPEEVQPEEKHDLQSYSLVQDRQKRNVRAPQRFRHEDLVAYAFTIAEDIEVQEPFTYGEAIGSPESKQWSLAMNEKMESLYKNNTWELVKPSKGFTQREGVDFNEVFSPVVKHSSICVLLAMVALHDMELQQLDVKTTFLHEIDKLKAQLKSEFEMKDLGAAKKILGMEIIRDRRKGRFVPLVAHFKLSSTLSPDTEEEMDYISRVPYASAVGSIMYAMVCTRHDIAQAVSVVSRYMDCPGKAYWEAVQWILRSFGSKKVFDRGEESHGIPGLVNLFGIESPGLTSSMAIAEHVASRLLKV
ncbi:retrovirus-related pol polyprotein from transposon TNT 1-94 [Tanacetum coccineum]|uniref:Retrovirus-related pol polyprotein from transposon TNT 1-94 n=1 Tax=Tanacetum coccineum TaxID=301880 RepID=A0ABQ5A5I4_9ASTR